MTNQTTCYKVNWLNADKRLQTEWFFSKDTAFCWAKALSVESEWVLSKHEITALASAQRKSCDGEESSHG